jgi:hypothetical protein
LITQFKTLRDKAGKRELSRVIIYAQYFGLD